MITTPHIDSIFKTLNNFSARSDDYMGVLYVNMFNNFPLCYKLYYNANDDVKYILSTESFNYNKDMGSRMDTRGFVNSLLELSKSDDNLFVFLFAQHEYFIVYDGTFQFLINISVTDHVSCDDFIIDVWTSQDNVDHVFNYLSKHCVKFEKQSDVEFGITATDVTGSLYTSYYEFAPHDIDINKNYNDDLPYNRICDLINKEGSSELLLFYGAPGTGKSSFIKHLITKHTDTSFVFLDGSLLLSVGQNQLITYFMAHQNTVFILEDCEKVLESRDISHNPIIGTLLNITDGIIADVLGIKIICTFNCAINKIDKALLRKGRLSLKYEFKPLVKDKVEKILDKHVDKDMTLADIYYDNVENDFSKIQSNKIGF